MNIHHCRVIRFSAAIAAACVPVCLALASGAAGDAANATVSDTLLDRYTAKRDASFAYELKERYEGTPGFTGYALDLTSQTWRDADEVSHPAWTHMVQIVVPDATPERPRPSTAILYIGGNRRKAAAPSRIASELTMMAGMTGSVVVFLPNVPNQPMELFADGRNRYEDDLLAESWTIAARTNDPTWIVHLAMVESAVAAMDATQAFLASDEGGNITIDDFVVSGGSKRGWTSWLTAAVDDRVRGVIPMVIDVMNLPRMVEHHWGAYGFWAPAIGDYAGRRLFEWLESPDAHTLRTIVDPYLYRDRFTMPKFILNAAGDEYFLPDTTRYFIDDLPGLTRLRIVPNCDHSIDDNLDAVQSALGFYTALLNNRDIPALSWSVAENDPGDRSESMRVTADAEPYEVTLWQAYNPKARDFRREEIGDVWMATTLSKDDTGAYLAGVETPETGFRAYMVQARFRIPGQALPVTFTTEVQVLPDVLPFADKPME